MAAPKPVGLITRKDTKAAKERRKRAESALRPKRTLPAKPPAALKGRAVASRLWRELIALYGELNAQIVSSLDLGLLTDLCLLEEQLQEMDALRRSAMNAWARAEKAISGLDKKEIAAKDLTLLLKTLNDSFDSIVELDARADRKRSLLHTLRQSLYLTPRSRAGVVPPEKPKEPKKSEMDKNIDGDDIDTPPPKKKKR